MTEHVVTIACPECGLETVDVFWDENEDPKRAEYHCACLALLCLNDEVSSEKDERDLVEVIEPNKTTLTYVENVKRAFLEARAS